MKKLFDGIEARNKSAYDNESFINDKSIYDNESLKDNKILEKNVYEIKPMNILGEIKDKRVVHPILKGVSQKELKRGIIFSEVLGKPKGLW